MLNRMAQLRSNASREAVMTAMTRTAADHYREYLRYRDATHNSALPHTERSAARVEASEAFENAMHWRDAINHLRRLDGVGELDLGHYIREGMVTHA